MNSHLKKFMLITSILSVLLFIVGALFFKFKSVDWYHYGFLILLVGYLFFSWAIQFVLYKYVKKRLAIFNRVFMLLTASKLFMLIGTMVLIAFITPAYFKYFLGELLVLYLIFSIFEITDILKITKKTQKK